MPQSLEPANVPAAIVEPSAAALVSVIVRSMDRPLLQQALASLAAQTHPHIEVLVVAVHAGQVHKHRVLGQLQPEVPVLVAVQRFVEAAAGSHQAGVEEHGVDGREVAGHLSHGIKRQIEGLPERAVVGVHQGHAGVGGAR